MRTTLISLALLAGLATAAAAATVKTDKAEYLPGEEMKVSFAGAPTDTQTAWIGVIPTSVPHGSEDTNDQHDDTYAYLEGRATGTVTLPAPGK
jgi:hypothetical protein